MIYTNIISNIPTLKKEDIIQVKFHKPSKIDIEAKRLCNKNYTGINILKINQKELTHLMKKAR